MGNHKVTITPNHDTPRTNDRGTTGSIQGTTNGRGIMGTTETPTTIQRRQPSVAGRTTYSHITPHHKVGTQTIQSFSHHQDTGSSDVPTSPSRTVEHTPGVSHGPPHTL